MSRALSADQLLERAGQPNVLKGRPLRVTLRHSAQHIVLPKSRDHNKFGLKKDSEKVENGLAHRRSDV